jgi:type I restriction enzyme, S subunit
MRFTSKAPFREAYESISVSNKKLHSRDYLASGLFPVIDQGQQEIAGFTNRSELVSHFSEPLILFGDHTRAIKYVDIPFVVGADGVRLYRAKEGFDSEYLYYFLRSASIPNDGYGRHSKHLEKLLIPNAPLATQRRIATELKTQLDAVEAARVAACGQLAEVTELKKQIFNELFSQIQNTAPIGSVAKVQSGYAFKSTAFEKQGTRLLRNANILPGKVYWTDQVCLPPEDAKAYPAYALAQGDVLISLDRPIISSGIKVARVLESDLPSLLVQRVGRFQVNSKLLDADFLYAFLQTQPFIEAVSGHDQSLGVPHVSPKQIESVEMPLPTLIEQKRLAKLMMEISKTSDKAKEAAMLQLSDLEQLPKRLLARAFDGEA